MCKSLAFLERSHVQQRVNQNESKKKTLTLKSDLSYGARVKQATFHIVYQIEVKIYNVRTKAYTGTHP